MGNSFFPAREPFNAYSHLLGALISLIWMGFLMVSAANAPISHKAAFLIYGITVFLMFFSSGVYHTLNVRLKIEETFRKLDHIMIYLVIAGTYTPLCTILLDDGWRFGMLLGIWLFAAAGIIKKIFWINAPRWSSTAIYLLMGWVAVIIMPLFWNELPHSFTYWIALGGIFYSVGAVIYAVQKPDPFPNTFGFHEIWHLFVIAGAFSHFWAIYYYLPGYN